MSSSSTSSSSETNNHRHVDERLIQSIRSALHLTTGKISLEQAASLSTSSDASFNMSNSAIAALTDLTFHYSTSLLANDLSSFSQHANRKVIKPEDVMLMARRDKHGVQADLRRKLREIRSSGKGTEVRGSKKPSEQTRRFNLDSSSDSSDDEDIHATIARNKLPAKAESSDSQSSGDIELLKRRVEGATEDMAIDLDSD